MNDSRTFFVTREMQAGFMAPIDSLRFFARHKLLLVSALAPHLALLVAALWASFAFGLPYASEQVVKMLPATGLLSGVSPTIVLAFVGIAIFIACILLYTLIGVAILNVLLSPLFDMIAAKAYVETSGRALPKLGWSDFVRSFLSESSKMILVYTAFIVAFFLPMLLPGGILFSIVIAPGFLVVSIWFFGWDAMDRTLALQGRGLRQRLLFGLRHFVGCMSLGVWMYVPFAGTLLSFSLSAAGALVVAKVER
jgi:hypothetical protein